MLMFTVPFLIGGGLFAALWASIVLIRIWHSIPRANADFEIAGLRYPRVSNRSNPAGAFYASSSVA